MRLTSYRIKPENNSTAIAEMARDAAGIARKIFATIAISNKIIPANRKFPINPKSLRVTVAYPAKAKSIVAVPPAARPINCGPLLNCNAALSSGPKEPTKTKSESKQ